MLAMSDGPPAPEMRLTRAAFVSRVADLATGWPNDGTWEATVKQILDHDAGLRAALSTPSPEVLREWAENWFDNPNVSPDIAIALPCSRLLTPGYLLRQIADALERSQRGDEG